MSTNLTKQAAALPTIEQLQILIADADRAGYDATIAGEKLARVPNEMDVNGDVLKLEVGFRYNLINQVIEARNDGYVLRTCSGKDLHIAFPPRNYSAPLDEVLAAVAKAKETGLTG